jgi:hypothetical protein
MQKKYKTIEDLRLCDGMLKTENLGVKKFLYTAKTMFLCYLNEKGRLACV